MSASWRPLTVNKSSTPPLGALVSALPLLARKNGKRASRVGPLAVIKKGVESSGATRGCGPLVNVNSGLAAGPVPPTAGWPWQDEQLMELKRGPSPLLVPPETTSTS